MYYDKDGFNLTDSQFRCLALTPGYKRIANSYGWVGKWRVSTVWLALDHGFGEGKPLIFESMAFEEDSWADVMCKRYSTEAEAREGHLRMVEEMGQRAAQPKIARDEGD